MSASDATVIGNPRARRRRLLRRRFLRRPLAIVCLLVILLFIFVGAFAPLIAPYDPSTTDFDAVIAAGGPAHASRDHLLGTDELGRDTLSRLIWGARASMQVGFLATMLGMLIAVPIGLIAGYYRGWIDSVISRCTDVLLAFPYVILAIGLAAILGPSLKTVTVAVGLAAVPGLVRVTRGETLALRESDFVPAALASGAGDRTIIFRHILPNMTSTLLVAATIRIPRAIIAEAALSYLGLGIRVPNPSWGKMLQESQSYFSTAPRLGLYPGLAIVIAAFAFNLLGDRLRDILDPKTTR